LDVPPPLSPAESLKKLHLPAGFEAKIVACEPQVLDPVALRLMRTVKQALDPRGILNPGKMFLDAEAPILS
jgi:FAD/FMN-containing dehydrogenase